MECPFKNTDTVFHDLKIFKYSKDKEKHERCPMWCDVTERSHTRRNKKARRINFRNKINWQEDISASQSRELIFTLTAVTAYSDELNNV